LNWAKLARDMPALTSGQVSTSAAMRAPCAPPPRPRRPCQSAGSSGAAPALLLLLLAPPAIAIAPAPSGEGGGGGASLAAAAEAAAVAPRRSGGEGHGRLMRQEAPPPVVSEQVAPAAEGPVEDNKDRVPLRHQPQPEAVALEAQLRNDGPEVSARAEDGARAPGGVGSDRAAGGLSQEEDGQDSADDDGNGCPVVIVVGAPRTNECPPMTVDLLETECANTVVEETKYVGAKEKKNYPSGCVKNVYKDWYGDKYRERFFNTNQNGKAEKDSAKICKIQCQKKR